MTEARFTALIPMKPLGAAKSRLDGVLGPAARADLVLSMFARVLGAALRSELIGEVHVITADPKVAICAKRAGVGVIDDASGDLNGALDAAASGLQLRGISDMVIILGDLPWLDAAALDAFLSEVPAGGCALAPDQHGRGTSALAWRAHPGLGHFAFGEDSLARHVALTGAAALPCRVIDPTPAFRDVDSAEDFDALSGQSGALLPCP